MTKSNPTEEVLSESQFQFHLEEYRLLKQELFNTYDASYKVVIGSFAANFAFITYFLTEQNWVKEPLITTFVIGAPIFVTLAAAYFYALRRESISELAEYVAILEQKLSAHHLGWEAFYSKKHAKDRGWFGTKTLVYLCFFAQILAIVFLYAIQK